MSRVAGFPLLNREPQAEGFSIYERQVRFTYDRRIALVTLEHNFDGEKTEVVVFHTCDALGTKASLSQGALFWALVGEWLEGTGKDTLGRLYASSVLAEDGDNELPAEPGNWEIVSFKPRLCVESEPIRPEILMANHFHDEGGTQTGMTDSEFVAALRVSRSYWNDKITLG